MVEKRVFNIMVLLGDTWENTERKVNLAKNFCLKKGEQFSIEINYSDLTGFQLNHIRNGIIPFSSSVLALADKIEFIDEDGSVKTLKNRRGENV